METYAATSPGFEERVLAGLGLQREPVSTQVAARDRHAELLQAIVHVVEAVRRDPASYPELATSTIRKAETTRTHRASPAGILPVVRPDLQMRLRGLG